MSDAPESLDGWLDDIWQRIARGVADRRAPARHPVLATVSPPGWPEARTVVLRAASRAEGTCEVHTDADSAKTAALHAAPRAELHVWEPRARLQMRLRAEVAVLTGAQAADRWARVPETSRAGYGKAPPTGQPIPGPLAYAAVADPARFAVLVLTLTEIDALHLGDRHRRARFRRAEDWRGCWLSP